MSSKVLVKPIVLGKIGSCYGIHGWLRLFSFTKIAKSILDYQPWYIRVNHRWEVIDLEKWCHCNCNMIVKLKSVDDRDSANFFANCEIFVDSLQLPTVTNGEHYWNDLIGCQVFTRSGYDLGKVISIIETGSNDVLIIKANRQDLFGIKERLIPFLDKQVIKKVELTAKIIEVDWDPSF